MVERYFELQTTQDVAIGAAVEAISDLQVDRRPVRSNTTLNVLSGVIDLFACGKGPGKDGIPPVVLKTGKPALLLHLRE